MNYEFKGTPAPWYPVCFAGFWEIMDGNYYADTRILDEESCDKAALNAKLASKAPEMFKMLNKIILTLDNMELSNEQQEEIVPIISEIEKLLIKITDEKH